MNRETVLCSSLLVTTVSMFFVAPAYTCERFQGSTMAVDGIASAKWRTDYPELGATVEVSPWTEHPFQSEPVAYMESVLSTFSGDFRIENQLLVTSGDEDWWIVPWMDYGDHGREPLMGLTKERRTEIGDLSPDSSAGHQVWAVGFYNAIGAETIGEIFEDLCDPKFPSSVEFKDGTVSIKFLFTDAPAFEAEYLRGAPVFQAVIDERGTSGSVSDRVRRSVRLLQVDIAVKDSRADPVGWVFGTFAWMGPKRGDGLFENLVPVSLQWGDDPGVYSADQIVQSWINPANEGVLFGWPERPSLGFHGRANGPADGMTSSCLSCHATAKLWNFTKIPWRAYFDRNVDFLDDEKVRIHVDDWFLNLRSGEFFNNNPNDLDHEVSALDYSLQLSEAALRMCDAWSDMRLTGPLPSVCSTRTLPPQYEIRGEPLYDVARDLQNQLKMFSIDRDVPPRQ